VARHVGALFAVAAVGRPQAEARCRAKPGGESDHAMAFFATQPHLAGVIPTDLVGINALYAGRIRCTALAGVRMAMFWKLSSESGSASLETMRSAWAARAAAIT